MHNVMSLMFTGSLAVLAACGGGSTSVSPEASTLTIETPATLSGTVLSTETPAPTQTATPIPSDDEVPWRSDLLLVQLGDPPSAPTMHALLSLVLQNQSTATCVMYGYPGVTFRDASGTALVFDYQHGGGQVVTRQPPRNVTLTPGGRAYVIVAKTSCTVGAGVRATTLDVVAPDGEPLAVIALPPYPLFDECSQPGGPGHVVNVSPIEPSIRETVALQQ
jgi:hypothetical protein